MPLVFSKHAANVTMALCGVGVDGIQLSGLHTPAPTLPFAAQTSRKELLVLILRMGLLSSLTDTEVTQILVQDHRASPFTTPQ